MKYFNNISFRLNILYILTLGTLICCKDIKSKSSQLISNELNYKLKTSCYINNFKISLLDDGNKNKYLSIKSDTEKLVKKIKIDTLINSSDIDIKCGKESFQLLFNEQQGNSYQTTIHSFTKNDKHNFVLNGIYITTSNRNGISISYRKIANQIKIDKYNGMFDNNSTEDVDIYRFSGFQEEKEPEIDMYFNKIKTLKNNKEKLKILSNENVLNFLTENIEITTSNISHYNDIAYYFEQSELYTEAIYLLETIVEKHPNRTVAYINIGDAYWGINKKEDAKKAYTIYITQMKEKGLKNKIPQRILNRVL